MPLHTFSFNQRNPLLLEINTFLRTDVIQHDYSLLILDSIASNPENIILIDFYFSQQSLQMEAQICEHILEITQKYNTHIFIISPAFKNEPLLEIVYGKFQLTAHYLSQRLLFELEQSLRSNNNPNLNSA